MMSFFKFTMIFSLIGFLIPLVFRALWSILNLSSNLNIHAAAEKLMLILWPTSLITLPASPEPKVELELFLFSMIFNVVFYTIIGALFGIGLRKHIAFSSIPAILLIAIWWWLLTR